MNAPLSIPALLQPASFEHEAQDIQLIETHISWVILGGKFAYKIKKPVKLGFLDYSTLERRQHFCREELRLNRRLAPGVYMDVVPVTGSPQAPRFGGAGPAIEYAVRMHRFPQEALLDRAVARGELRPDQVDEMATLIAAFHQGIRRASPESDFGNPEAVRKRVDSIFAQTLALTKLPALGKRIKALRAWSEDIHGSLAEALARRKREGFVRECHGDMHLGNMAFVDSRIVVFDGIEFSEELHWIHVMSEVAFLVMDLEHRGRSDYAWRFLNGYLERTGDYDGLVLLRYFQVYRAMVRAMVTRIRLQQKHAGDPERPSLETEFMAYLERAETYTRGTTPRLIITRGLSGSGKTTVARTLASHLGAVHIRSDVERKRLFLAGTGEPPPTGIDEGMYSADAGKHTYGRLRELALQMLKTGYPVVVDATFLELEQRAVFRRLAEALQVPFTILDIRATERALRDRIVRRAETGSDASDANLRVLAHQRQSAVPLAPHERPFVVAVDGMAPPDGKALATALTVTGLH